MQVRATSRCRDARGAVAVEFALVFPLLAMLVMGVATAGISYSRAVGLANATREGARFGATADACGGATTSPPCATTTLPGSSTWAADTISRVRSTQFDDGDTKATSTTSVCVQLFKKTAGAGTVLVPWTCQKGDKDAPTIQTPSGPDAAPKVPAETPTNACVVRVIAARKFTINAVLLSWTRANVARSVARYERMDRVAQCI